MIERYATPEMSQIWSEEHKFGQFLKIELAFLEEILGNKVTQSINVDVDRIKELESITHHDVIAFCSSITEQLPAELARFFHYGLTSSDIIDTALMLSIKESLNLIMPELNKVLATLKEMALRDKNVPCIGRSHGMHAEPMSLGQKWLGFYCIFERTQKMYEDILLTGITGALSGAVGNYTVVSPEMEFRVLSKLGLNVEPVSTQIISRDRFAHIVMIGSMLATNIEQICLELRHLHRSEVSELCEGKASGQKGSSTMPHKKNPISCENLTGLSRILRSHYQIALENSLLWHERDITHSSAERLLFPDHFGLIFYSLKRLVSTLDKLVIDYKNVERNLQVGLEKYSSIILHKLLVSHKYSREELYTFVQQLFFNNHWKNLEEILVHINNSLGIEIKSNELIFLQHTDSVYKRVFKNN